MATTPMFAPDGSIGDVPLERVAEAKAKGFTTGTEMRSPDGQVGVIPTARIADAMKQGFLPHGMTQNPAQPTQFEQQRNPANQPGVLSTLFSGLKDIGSGLAHPQAQNPYPGMGTDAKVQAYNQAVQQGQQERAAGYSTPYIAATIPAQAVGENVPAIEHQADIGNARGVIGYSAAPVAAGLIAEGANRGVGAAADTIKAARATPRDNLIAAVNPGKRTAPDVVNAVDNLPDSTLRDIAQSNPRTTSDLANAITAKQKALQSQFQAAKAPVASMAVDTTPIANAMEARITPGMKFKYPELVKQIQAEAAQYRGKTMTVDQLDSLRDTLNDGLAPQYRKNGLTRAEAKKSPDFGYRFAEAEGVRDALYGAVEDATGKDLSGLKMQQSNMRKLQDALGDAQAQARVADAKNRSIPAKVRVANTATSLMDFKTGTAIRQALRGMASKTGAADSAVSQFSDKLKP